MTDSQVPLRLYMTSPVVTAAPSDSLREAFDRMLARGISSLPVVDGERLVGVITRTDLLRVGRREAGNRAGSAPLVLPDRPVSTEMTTPVFTVGPDTPVAEAALLLRKERVHRVYVTEPGPAGAGADGRVVGVLSTRDLMRVLEERRDGDPVSRFMTTPVFTIEDQEALAVAVERLGAAKVSGLIVIEDGWPVGVFAQEEALDARELPRTTAVGDVMNPRILVLSSKTTLHRAAAQARAMDVARVVLQGESKLDGILSGLDFATAVEEA